MNWREDKQMPKGKKEKKSPDLSFCNFYDNSQNMSIHVLEEKILK